MQVTDRRMTAERCAFLSSVAMANGVEESWMGLFPIIPLLYLRAYLPYLSSKSVILSFVVPTKVNRIVGPGYKCFISYFKLAD